MQQQAKGHVLAQQTVLKYCTKSTQVLNKSCSTWNQAILLSTHNQCTRELVLPYPPWSTNNKFFHYQKINSAINNFLTTIFDISSSDLASCMTGRSNQVGQPFTYFHLIITVILFLFQVATEKDFIDAINKVIKAYAKFSSTPRYMTYN